MNDPKIEELNIGHPVIAQCENGVLITGPWNGTTMWRGEPIVTIGKRTEYFKNVLRVDKVVEVKTVYSRE